MEQHVRVINEIEGILIKSAKDQTSPDDVEVDSEEDWSHHFRQIPRQACSSRKHRRT